MLKIETLVDDGTGGSAVDGRGEDTDALRLRHEAETIYGAENEIEGGVGDTQAPSIESAGIQITKLAPGVKDSNRVNVFLNGRFAFSLDVAQVVDLGVKAKQNITVERLKELRDASEFGKLYQRTLEWVLTRPHSIQETRDYLKRCQQKRILLNRQRVRDEKKPLPELQEATMILVIERLVEKGYLDDAKFAVFFVENRMVRKGISQKKLIIELRRKGISADVAKTALENVARPEEEEILKVIKKKRAKYDDHRLVSYLVRQGFNYQKVKDAVESYQSEE